MTASDQASWPLGFRINPRVPGVGPDLVEAFRGVPVAVASDCMGRNVGAVGLKTYHGDLNLTMCGSAFTVRLRPGDNLMLHKALELAQPGDVLVIDGGGVTTQSLIGGLMRLTAITAGIAGFVIDGAIRDIADWAQGVMPVYAKGHNHRGPGKDGPGEINVPVACAGMAVHPGDLVLGDADGVLTIPAAEAAALLPAVRAQMQREAAAEETNRKRRPDPERINAILRSKGCPV